MRPAELAYLDVAKARAERYRLAWVSARRRARAARFNFHQMLRLSAQRGLETERYRLAWISARQRAMNHLMALVESEEERDGLRAALRDLNEEAAGYIRERDAARIGEAGYTRLAEQYRMELFEARDEVAKAGEEIRRLRADRAWEANRANEAARLSADARDDAEARDQVIAELREHIEIVEGDRLTVLAWALNVLAEHGVEHVHGEEFAAIAQHIRDLKDAVATYRHVTDSSIQTREEAIAEAERLAADNTRLIEEVRTLREQPIRQGPERAS